MPEGRQWRVIVWAAVSSRPQAEEDKASLPEQERAGRAFAEQIGGVVVDVLTVPGHSRDYVLYSEAEREMEAYVRLREHCEARAFDLLWCRSPDRLGRDAALVQACASLVQRAGAELYLESAPHALGQATTGHRYLVAIGAVSAQEENDRRIALSRMGTRRRVARGLPASHWPIGYRAVRDPATGETIGGEPDELAPAVEMATRLFLAGRSYAAIVAALDASPYRPVRADHWSYGTVRGMLYNDLYAGLVSWGDYAGEEPSDRFPALWDAETVAAVQRERGRRALKIAHRSDGCPFLDVAFCARCGSRMTQNRRDADHVYVRCSRHARKDLGGGAPCHPNYTRQEAIRAAIVTVLEGVRSIDSVRRLRGELRDDTRERARLAAIAGELEAAHVRRQRLALAYAAAAMDLEVYRLADEEIVRQVEAWEAEAAQLEAQLAQVVPHAARLQAVEQLRPMLQRAYERTDPRELAAALQAAGIEVWCEEGAVVEVKMR